ncbi:MAG TPA: hypothetical protein VJ652_16445 [Noviherbaspirillum sp.]|nr:hypothetical protein [Noviherbaspirillum sp.]
MGIFTEQLSGRYQAAKEAISAIEEPLSGLVQQLGATYSCDFNAGSAWVNIHPEVRISLDRAAQALEAAFPAEQVERGEVTTSSFAQIRLQRGAQTMPAYVTVFAAL